MKNKSLFFLLSFCLAYASFGHTSEVFAINAPLLGSIPKQVNADVFDITIYADKGATVSVVGGSSELSPVTDGEGGDMKDGKVVIRVPLAQNTLNSFSITAQINGQTSDSVLAQINEVSQSPDNEIPVPTAPVLVGDVPDFVKTPDYLIVGTTEANANIYVRTVTGILAGSTKADSKGQFKVTVSLKEGETNRFNVSAENEYGKEGKATQIVIRQSGETVKTVVQKPIPALTTSSQIFFNDIEGHWAKEYINELLNKKIVSGKSEGIFDPNGFITRAELTKIAILAFGHSVNTNVKEHPFQDVPKNAWFAPYVEEAKRLGFIQGYSTGGFGPNDFITRAATLKILLGAAGINPAGNEPDFSDVPSGLWFSTYVGFGQKKGIVSGYSDGSFGPSNKVTRGQVAKMVVKLLELVNSDV